eukprot:TRINITY_DN30293_c0_g1_i2.p3 TRINITY_DN30293_c0_g1~~TRINITY_DN30293_c0_g1_i2.p3  ORF type:complete len:144 (+),score=20.39 TRINITY_DN30293_c0_g1_i2:540-971(+)
MWTCNMKLRQQLQELQQRGFEGEVKQRVKHGLIERLMMNAPYINSLPQAYALACTPNRLQTTLQLQHAMIDDIWHFAGDKSSDISWYVKRMALAGIYAATELYMITDFSSEFSDTKEALERRLEEIQELAQVFRVQEKEKRDV